MDNGYVEDPPEVVNDDAPSHDWVNDDCGDPEPVDPSHQVVYHALRDLLETR